MEPDAESEDPNRTLTHQPSRDGPETVPSTLRGVHSLGLVRRSHTEPVDGGPRTGVLDRAERAMGPGVTARLPARPPAEPRPEPPQRVPWPPEGAAGPSTWASTKVAHQLIGRAERAAVRAVSGLPPGRLQAVARTASGPSVARSTGADDGRRRPPDAQAHCPTAPEHTSPDRPRSPGNDRSALFVTPPERSSRTASPSGKVAVREGGRGAARSGCRPVRFGPARHDLCRFARKAWQHPPEEQTLPTVRQVGGDPWQRAETDAEAARAAAD